MSRSGQPPDLKKYMDKKLQNSMVNQQMLLELACLKEQKAQQAVGCHIETPGSSSAAQAVRPAPSTCRRRKAIASPHEIASSEREASDGCREKGQKVEEVSAAPEPSSNEARRRPNFPPYYMDGQDVPTTVNHTLLPPDPDLTAVMATPPDAHNKTMKKWVVGAATLARFLEEHNLWEAKVAQVS